MKALERRFKNIGEIKWDVKDHFTCPVCGEKVRLGVEVEALQKAREEEYYPYPHVYLHGDPLHAILCYIDKDHNVRGTSPIKSIEISRDSTTFQQIMKKWSNPT